MTMRLADVRKSKGLTLEKLSDLLSKHGLEISSQHLQRLEKGERRYNQDHVEALARAFNISQSELFEEIKPPKEEINKGLLLRCILAGFLLAKADPALLDDPLRLTNHVIKIYHMAAKGLLNMDDDEEMPLHLQETLNVMLKDFNKSVANP